MASPATRSHKSGSDGYVGPADEKKAFRSKSRVHSEDSLVSASDTANTQADDLSSRVKKSLDKIAPESFCQMLARKFKALLAWICCCKKKEEENDSEATSASNTSEIDQG